MIRLLNRVGLILLLMVIISGCSRDSGIIEATESQSASTADNTHIAATTPDGRQLDTSMQSDSGTTGTNITAASPDGRQSVTSIQSGSETTDTNIVTVSNFEELIRSIGSDREIRLKPGNYDPAAYGLTSPEVVSVNNLSLVGIPEGNSEYVDFITSAGSETVLEFKDCRNIRIAKLNLGHARQLQCSGDVVAIENSKDFKIEECRLFGCGIRGLVLNKASNIYCNNLLVEDCVHATFQINLCSNIMISDSVLRGSTMEIGDGMDAGSGEGIKVENCVMLNKKSISSVYSTNNPYFDAIDLGIFIGTEEWNEGRRPAAIKYSRYAIGHMDMTLENTYDGDEDIYREGKFVELSEKLEKVSGGSAYLSMDYIADNGGNIKGSILNINLLDEGQGAGSLAGFTEEMSKLRTLAANITEFGCPVTISYGLKDNPDELIAIAEFTAEKLVEYLEAENREEVDKYCKLMMLVNAADSFYGINAKYGEIVQSLRDLLIAKDDRSRDPNYGRHISPLFLMKRDAGYNLYSALESFAGEGDFMHYSTDLIIRTDIKNGDNYLLCEGNTYKIAGENNPDKKVVLDSLRSEAQMLDGKVEGEPDENILLFIDGEQEDVIEFIFMTVSRDPEGYAEAVYSYYKGAMDASGSKITSVEQLKVANFQDI